MKRGLILDVDNTLYNWVDAFSPSFRSQVHKLSQLLKVPEEGLTDDFARVYKMHGTVEYPDAVNDLGIWSELSIPEEMKKEYVSKVKQVFSITYKRNLRLYPSVREVLTWARDEDITIIGLSDALERWVIYRLRTLGIERYFSGLYTWHKEPWFLERQAVKSSIKFRTQLQDNELKPNADVVNRVVMDFKLDKAHSFMVGDSVSKDVVAAQMSGIRDIWARYGTTPLEGNLDTLRRITPWTSTQQGAEIGASNKVIPSHSIDDFSELISIIGSSRLRLFDL